MNKCMTAVYIYYNIISDIYIYRDTVHISELFVGCI